MTNFFKFFQPQELPPNAIISTPSKSSPLEREMEMLKERNAEKDRLIRENSHRIDILEQNLKSLEIEEQMKEDKIRSICRILNEYEKLVYEVLTEREKYLNNKDSCIEHLGDLEKAFTELHSKYEQAKFAVDGFASNERLLLTNLDEYHEKVNLLETQIIENNDVITEKTKELEDINKKNQTEIKMLKTNINELERIIENLKNNLEVKEEENNKLTQLYGNINQRRANSSTVIKTKKK